MLFKFNFLFYICCGSFSRLYSEPILLFSCVSTIYCIRIDWVWCHPLKTQLTHTWNTEVVHSNAPLGVSGDSGQAESTEQFCGKFRFILIWVFIAVVCEEWLNNTNLHFCYIHKLNLLQQEEFLGWMTPPPPQFKYIQDFRERKWFTSIIPV